MPSLNSVRAVPSWVFVFLCAACSSSGTTASHSGSDGGRDANNLDHATEAALEASDAPSASDASSDDANSKDAGNQEADAGNQDAGADSSTDGGTVYHDMTDPSYWSTFDATTVNPGAAGFYGGTFDGRYVYFAPYSNPNAVFDGLVTRYDTHAAFKSASSWSTFDTSTVNSAAKGFSGATFDGRYVYFVPRYNGVTDDGVVARYDTQGGFSTPSSWSTFDTTTVNANASGFASATFDGRYIYFVPVANSIYIDGIVVRYDTQGSFSSVASWSTFDASSVNSASQGFAGGVFDGRYAYFVPNGGTARDGVVTRYDTQGTFTSTAAWSTFDVTGVNAAAKGFVGGGFDGRYVYLVPYDAGFADGGSYSSGLVARYDTQANFGAASSWSTFDMTALNANAKGFLGAAFDGRYMYFVPNGYLPVDGLVTRYDTRAAFSVASSWSTFDTTSLNPNAKGFFGAVFDGRYLYFVPYGSTVRSGVVVRFDAKSPPSMPNLPAFHGSFY